jgi:O-antigen/teichoic acid export membrane protein
MKTIDQTTEHVSLASRAAYLAAAKFIALALALVLPLLLVRKLSQMEFGLYKQAFQILSTMLSLLVFQMGASAYYFMPRQPNKKGQVAFNVLLFYAALGAAVAVCFALFPHWITSVFRSDDLQPYLPFVGLAILLWLIASNLEAVIIANGDVRAASAFIVATQIIKTSFLLGAAIIFGELRTMLLAAIAYGAVHCLLTLAYLRARFGRFWQGFDWTLCKAQLANALPFGVGYMAFAAQSDLHNYFVSHYFDAAAFAIYSVGAFQLPPLMLLLDSVETILLPEVARLAHKGDYPGIIRAWMNAMRQLALFFIPACALLFVLRYEFITLLFTANYLASAEVFAISLVLALVWINLSAPVLRAFDEFKYFRMRFCFLLLPLSWAAFYAGMRVAGLAGVMAAMVGVRAFDAAVTWMVIGRKLGVAREDVRQLAPILRITASALAAALITFGTKQWLAPLSVWAVLMICSVVFGATYLSVVLAAGAVTEAEKAELRHAWERLFRYKSSRVELSSAPDV